MNAHDESNERWQDRSDALAKELAKELADEQERHRATLQLLSKADAEFAKVMIERDGARLDLECARRIILETTKERDEAEEQFHAARAEAERLKAALVAAMQAVNDWIITYAADQCGQEEVKAARKRISDGGGTLAYVTDIMEMADKALAATAPKSPP
jgi:hypothetical protein